MSSEGSSGGNGGGSGGGAASFLPYLCSRCRRGILITPAPSPPSEILCPICHDINGQSVSLAGHRHPFRICIDLGGHDQTPWGSNPSEFLHMYTDIRANISYIQLVSENTSLEGGFQLPSNLDRYFENVPTSNAAPPASRSAVEALPDVKITAELLASKSPACAVCKEDFELDGIVKQMMPCTHIFHSACLLTWLEQNNSCPMCRRELPTDDPDYENRTTTNPRTPTWYRPPTWAQETTTTGTASGSSAPTRVTYDENGGEALDENTLRIFRVRWQAWFRAQNNDAGYRVVNVGLATVPSVTLVIRHVSGGTPNENSLAPRGFRIRIRIPTSAWSRPQPAEQTGNTGAGNNAPNQ